MPTILELLRAAADRRPAAPALMAPGRAPLSHRGLLAAIDRVHAALASLGVGPGDRVAVVMPDGVETAVVNLAVATGATCCPLSPDSKREELAFAFDDLRPRALLTLAGVVNAAREVAAARQLPVVEVRAAAGEPAGAVELRVEDRGAAAAAAAPRLAVAADVALILHTSGTTARPKAVPLSHGNICATADNLIRAMALTAADVCLNVMPMFHVGSLVDLLVPPLAAGGAVACGGAFDATRLGELVRELRPTWLQVVPAMAHELLARYRERPDELLHARTLRVVRAVAAAVPPALVEEFEAAFGVPLLEVYGMTETATLIATNPLPPAPRKPGSVGRPAGPEVAILGDDGRPLASPQRGEVGVRGPSVMAGYLGDPAANAASFVDGWFRTGDVGWLDEDGDLFLVGRIKEIVNRGGEKVSPAEVDEALRAHPEVLDAGAFAVPHPSLGEEVAAAVVRAPGSAVGERELREFVAARLAWYKVPRRVCFVAALPRTATGKLRRAELAAQCAAALADDRAAPVSSAAPATPLGQVLAAMWARALELDAVGADDHFFDLGGDSLRAAVFVNELQRVSGEPILVSAVFDAPTLSAFEELVARDHPAAAARLLAHAGVAAEAPAVADGRARVAVTPALRREFRSLCVAVPPADDDGARKNPRAVFVLCPPRSGSTLLRVMLAGNRQLFAPPELYLLSFRDLAERRAAFTGAQRGHLEGNLRALMQLHDVDADGAKARMAELEQQRTSVHDYYGMLQRWAGDRLLVDKTPYYGVHAQTLRRVERCFEEPLYVHLVRHPHAVIRSFEQLRMEKLWWPRLTGQPYSSSHPCPYDSAVMGELVWSTVHENICALLADVPPVRCHRLAYEDLVRQPEAELRSLCRFLGVAFDDGMLDLHADPALRMTDGIHAVSQMVGDVKFHQHRGVVGANADAWRADVTDDFLSDETWALAERLGYHERPGAARGAREEFEF